MPDFYQLSDKDLLAAIENRYDDGTLQFGWSPELLDFREVCATVYTEDLTQAVRIVLGEHFMVVGVETVKWGEPRTNKYTSQRCESHRTIHHNGVASLWNEVFPKVMAGYNGLVAQKAGLLKSAVEVDA